MGDTIPAPLRRVSNTRSSTQLQPIHKLYLTSHHSSQEHAIYGTSFLLRPFSYPSNFPLQNPKSISSNLSPSPLSFSFSSFAGALCRPLWPFFLIRKKKHPKRERLKMRDEEFRFFLWIGHLYLPANNSLVILNHIVHCYSIWLKKHRKQD